tara:strand:- start:1027 stop:1326 length:300 start_codon:yes stop_codon:yes gene_type:complete
MEVNYGINILKNIGQLITKNNKKMRTYKENASLTDFEFWSGGKDFADNLTYTELKEVENQLEDLYPEGMTETQINDLFWFDDEGICEMLGLDIDEVYNR